MELEFRADGSDGEPELFIHLDVDGLAALLRAVETAMTSGQGELIPAAAGRAIRAGDGSPGGFAKVIVTFGSAGSSGDQALSGTWIIPEGNPAALQLPGRA